MRRNELLSGKASEADKHTDDNMALLWMQKGKCQSARKIVNFVCVGRDFWLRNLAAELRLLNALIEARAEEAPTSLRNEAPVSRGKR